MSRRIKRRTIYGTPVKGAVRWLPHRVFLFFIIHEDDNITFRFRMRSSQLGVDLNNNHVDAQYRVLSGDPNLETVTDLSDPIFPICKYEDLDIFSKKTRTVIHAFPFIEGMSAQEVVDHYAPKIEQSVNGSMLWSVPAGLIFETVSDYKIPE